MNPEKYLNSLGIISVSGTQAEAFLQGQITCDIKELSATQASAGALCDAKGRVQVTFILLQHSQEYLFILPLEIIPIALKRLQKYAVFSKVRIEEVSKQWYLYGVQEHQTSNRTHFTIDTIQNEEIHIYFPGNICRYLLLSKNSELNTSCCNDAAWQLGNIEAGFASILPATSGLFTPQMINLEKFNGVSFKKGCYLGQEIIARTQHLGKLKRHLHLIDLPKNNMLQAGDPLTNAENITIGTIVNISLMKNSSLALATIEDRALEDKGFN